MLLTVLIFVRTPIRVCAQCEGAGAKVCKTVTDNPEACKACVDSCKSYTAVGCIGGGNGDIASLLDIGTGAGGGIAFLLILFGGFQILTSAGNPDKLNEGRELISAAIAGLLMIIFSVFLLRIIGINILGLPTFGPK